MQCHLPKHTLASARIALVSVDFAKPLKLSSLSLLLKGIVGESRKLRVRLWAWKGLRLGWLGAKPRVCRLAPASHSRMQAGQLSAESQPQLATPPAAQRAQLHHMNLTQ